MTQDDKDANTGTPPSPSQGDFPNWETIEAWFESITRELSAADKSALAPCWSSDAHLGHRHQPWFMTAALGLLFVVRFGLWQSRRHDCHS